MIQKKSNPIQHRSKMMGRPITWKMVEDQALEGLDGLMQRNVHAARLMVNLIKRMAPGDGGVVVVSRQTIAELLNCSIPSVQRALKILIDEGWVQRMRIGGAYALAINYRIAWVGPRDDIQHAVFGATVIASRSEQDAIALQPPPMRQVPIVEHDEIPLPIGPGLPPPSQPQLEGIPPTVATWAPPETNLPSMTINWSQHVPLRPGQTRSEKIDWSQHIPDRSKKKP